MTKGSPLVLKVVGCEVVCNETCNVMFAEKHVKAKGLDTVALLFKKSNINGMARMCG